MIRNCAWAECNAPFMVQSKVPAQRFCSKRCWTRNEHAKRAERWRREKAENKARGGVRPAFDDVEKEEIYMSPVRLRQAEERLAAARAGAVLEQGREKSHRLWETWLAMWRKAA